MSEPTTLGEALLEMDYRAKYHADPDHTNAWLQGYRAAAAWDASQLRRILYGTDEPCRPCGGLGYDPIRHVGCSACHDTGHIKTPGLVERVCAVSDAIQQNTHPAPPMADRLLFALRREIGETTP